MGRTRIGRLALAGCLGLALLLAGLPATVAAVAGTWATTGGLHAARYVHTATLLQDGKVLVAGGLGTTGSPLATAELYDPASGTWATTGSLHVARSAHTATLLPGGKVLV